MDTKARHQVFSYGSLGFSLGFIGLPLYVYLPKYYAESFGLSLVFLSALLFASRVIDTIQDPLIGWFSDRLVKKKITRKQIILVCFPFLALSFLALLFPQDIVSPGLWISFFLIGTYTLYSFLTINYYTMAAEIYEDYNKQTVLVTAREGLALGGITVGSILPATLLNMTTVEMTHFITWGTYILAASVGVFLVNRYSPPITFRLSSSENFLDSLRIVRQNRPYLILALIFLLSTIAAALPATLVLFYIEDVLQGKAYFGLFLMIYFLCALGGLPLWYKLSVRYTKRIAWMGSMVLTISGFIWATFLGPGDFIAYGIICVVTGFCLGADLTMPTSLLGDLIKQTPNKAKYYGIWGMLGKSSIAVAGSLGLFVLGWLDYQPGTEVTPQDQFYVSLSYAFIPCVIKLISFIVLYKASFDRPLEKK